MLLIISQTSAALSKKEGVQIKNQAFRNCKSCNFTEYRLCSNVKKLKSKNEKKFLSKLFKL